MSSRRRLCFVLVEDINDDRNLSLEGGLALDINP